MVRPLDTLLAHKIINLSDLSGTEKRIAGTLIDSFNRKTGQCDPSLDRIAELVGVHRRTVIRAMPRLESSGLFRCVRHGGNLHRNRYEPVWERFQQLERLWRSRFGGKALKSVVTSMSPSQRQSCHLGGDQNVTQTYRSNLPKGTCSAGQAEEGDKPRPVNAAGSRSSSSTMASSDVARVAAERRWFGALHERYSHHRITYAEIIERLDEDMRHQATEAELRRHGDGLRYITRCLKLGPTEASDPQRPQDASPEAGA
jgi:hypothetical protein